MYGNGKVAMNFFFLFFVFSFVDCGGGGSDSNKCSASQSGRMVDSMVCRKSRFTVDIVVVTLWWL